MKYVYFVGHHASNFHFSKFVNAVDTELGSEIEFIAPIPPLGTRLYDQSDQLVLQHAVANGVPSELQPIFSKTVPLDDLCDAIGSDHKYALAATIIANNQIREPELVANTRFMLYQHDIQQLVDFVTLQPIQLNDNESVLPLFSITRFGNSNTYVVVANTSVCCIPSNIDIRTDTITSHTIGAADECLSDELISPMVNDAIVSDGIIIAPPRFFTIDLFSGINVKVDAFEQQLRWNAANVSVTTNLELVMEPHSIRIRPSRDKVGYIHLRINANEFFNTNPGIGGSFTYTKIIIQE